MNAIFLDLETSGLDAYQHSVLDIAFKIIDVHTGKILYAYQSIVKHPFNIWQKGDPASLKFNGFTFEKIQSGKEIPIIRAEIIKIFQDFEIKRGKDVFICQNPAFDRGFFSHIIEVYTQEEQNWPYHWLDLASMYWAIEIKSNSADKIKEINESFLSKNAIAQHFNIPPEVSPHSAMNGVDHLIKCYETVVGFR